MDMSIRFPGLNLVLDHVPRSLEIFGFEITIYGVLIAIGMLLGIFFVVLEARRNHEDPDAYLDLAIITLLSGVAGARLLYAAFSWSLYKNDPGQLLNIRSGGLMFYGGLLGGVLGGAVYCRIRKKSFWQMADLACMEKMLSAYSPKDSLLKKLPHFPIICPIRSPMQARSAICQKDFFRILQ